MFPCFRSRILLTSTVLLAVLLAMIVFEKESIAQTSLSLKTVKSSTSDSPFERLSGGLTVTGVSDFKESGAQDKEVYSQYELAIGLDINETNKLSLYIPFQKDLSQRFEEKFFADAKLSHTLKNIWNRNGIVFNHTTSLVYPTTETSKLRDEMYTGFELSPSATFDLSALMTGLSFTYLPRYRRRFHKFTTDREGESLVSESLLQFFVASYAFTDKWAFESTLVYVNSSRYDGASVEPSYLTVQELQRSLNESFSLAAGIQTGGSLVSPERGRAESVQVFDNDSSTFYAAASVKF